MTSYRCYGQGHARKRDLNTYSNARYSKCPKHLRNIDAFEHLVACGNQRSNAVLQILLKGGMVLRFTACVVSY